jgi:hypothetical protein
LAPRGVNGERELVMAHRGKPTPPAFLKGPIDRGVTNIRNTKSPPQFRGTSRLEYRVGKPYVLWGTN